MKPKDGMIILGCLAGMLGFNVWATSIAYSRGRSNAEREAKADPLFGHHNMYLVEDYGPFRMKRKIGVYTEKECAWCNKETGQFPPSRAVNNESDRASKAEP